MPHLPKPFFKKSCGVGYVEIDPHQHNLGPDRGEAFRQHYQLMGQPREQKVSTGSLAEIVDAFLEWRRGAARQTPTSGIATASSDSSIATQICGPLNCDRITPRLGSPRTLFPSPRDSAYRGDRRRGWDTGRPSSELRKAVEEGILRPCRAVVLGCGSGTDAIYLAGNANEAGRGGPPRVKEEELRGDSSESFDFEWLRETRFDPRNAAAKGPLAWSALLRRKREP